MDAENRNEEAIFKAAIEIDSAIERAAFVKSACGEDAELLRRVEGLLKFHYDDDHFLKSPPVGADIALDTSPLTEGPGTKIGRYKLLQLIGEGGFGVVYMAEQTKPIRRRVALKIIKWGMDTKQVIARFEAERQALAMMDHPNIAKVLDAGATDTGRPYFVMELVKGIPITEYCDKNELNTRQRLELFADVCKAVQHAHQKGIIHRDLKPSNVMITLSDDDSPVPKIIDFGIAKATQARLTEKTVFTEYQQFIGTPEYMSPEQAEMSGLDVDTRSDIYSLGVLLYELLTGTTPFEAKQLRSAAFDEIVRIIREEEPDKPSTRLSTLGNTLAEIAKHRHVKAGELCKIVRGDLDWVVMKALEKDRTRRYETANELVQDIQRHLGDEPVAAGPPNTIYRVRKFVRRHRTGVVAGLVFMTSLIIGFSLAIAGFMQASHQRDLAEAYFRKAREAVDQMLTLVAEELPRLPGISKQLDSTEVTKIKQALLETALKYYEGFLEERSSDLNIRYETAHAYMRVGDITRSMDQDKRAEETYFAAANLLEELVAEFPNEFDYHKDLAFAYHGYGDMLRNAGRIKEKNDVYRKSAISYGNAFKLNQNDAFSWFDCANVYDELGQRDKAVSNLSEAIKLNPNCADYWHCRADLYIQLGQLDKAESDYSTVLGIYSKALELDPDDGGIWSERADVYIGLKQFDKALADYSKAIELEPGSSFFWYGRAGVYTDLKQFDKALADYSRALALDPGASWIWSGRAGLYTGLEQWDKADADYSKAIELNPGNAWSWSGRANVYRELQQWHDALADYSKAIELDPGVHWLWGSRADAYRELEQWDKAVADLSKVIELDPNNADSWLSRADVYRELEQWDKAIADYSKAIELDPGNASYWSERADVYREFGQWDKAIGDYSKAIELNTRGEDYYLYNLRQRARMYAQNKHSDKALTDYYKIIESYSKAIELDPGTVYNWFERADAYRELGQLDKAVDDLSKVIELDPGNASYWSERADAYRELGQWDKAIADYSKAIELDPNNRRNWDGRRGVYGELEQWDKVLADFTQILRIVTDENSDGYPDDANLLNNFAWFLVTCPSAEIRDGARAIEHANQACALTNWLNVNYINTLAAAYAEAGDFDSAVKWQRKAIELLPKSRAGYESRLKRYQTGESLAARQETAGEPDGQTNEPEVVPEKKK